MKKILFAALTLLVSVEIMAAFDGTKTYTIRRNGNTSAYMYADGTKISCGTLNSNDASYFWKLIPTANADCYYLQNYGTEEYIQTSKITLSSLVGLGSTQVEYKVSTGAGTSTYFMASTDQTIDYTFDGTLGLNFGANGVCAYYIKTGRGNSYWDIVETAYNPQKPEPAEEDPDACKNVVAYRMPCGTYGSATVLSDVKISGNGVLKELNYTVKNSSRFHLYTTERATVAKGGTVVVNATLKGYNTPGLGVTVWADFDGDGQFEQSVKPIVQQNLEAELTVPADTKGLKGRIRIRVDQSDATGANADIYGVCYDFPVFIEEGSLTTRTLTIRACDEVRGLLAIKHAKGLTQEYECGAEVTVYAEACPGYTFTGWRQGRTVVSTSPAYTTTMTENKTLIALFTVDKYTKTTKKSYSLAFTNTHSETPKVVVRNELNEMVDDVTASVVNMSPAQKVESAEGAAVLMSTDLTPNECGKNERSMTFCINGLPQDFALENIKVNIAATDSVGDFVATGISAFYDYQMLVSQDNAQYYSFAKLENKNLNQKPGEAPGWSFTASGAINSMNPLYLTIKFTPLDETGMFATVKGVVITKSSKTPVPVGVEQMNVEETSKNSQIYNLAGQRMEKVQKGFNIVNGQKIIVK